MQVDLCLKEGARYLVDVGELIHFDGDHFNFIEREIRFSEDLAGFSMVVYYYPNDGAVGRVEDSHRENVKVRMCDRANEIV